MCTIVSKPLRAIHGEIWWTKKISDQFRSGGPDLIKKSGVFLKLRCFRSMQKERVPKRYCLKGRGTACRRSQSAHNVPYGRRTCWSDCEIQQPYYVERLVCSLYVDSSTLKTMNVWY